MPNDTVSAEIYCDESGHDGENLMAGVTPVFAHGSVHMDRDEAFELVEYLRKTMRIQSPELKASAVLRGGDALLDELFGSEGRLVGLTQVYLVEKANFAVGKIIDLLVEEEAYHRGVNLYAGGVAKRLADDLYEYGARALGVEGWNDLVSGFTSLMRTKQRKGGEKETVDSFFEKVDNYRLKSRREKVSKVLELVWKTRRHADDFQAAIAEGMAMRTLDPLQTSLYQLAFTWYLKLQKPIMIMHDEQTALTEPMLKMLIRVANEGSPKSYKLPNIKFPLLDVKHVDSKTDPRIQLADISAGFCRQVAENALKGTAEDKRLTQVRRLVHFNSIWGDSRSWEQIRPRD